MTRVFLIAASVRERERLEELLEDAGAELVGSAANTVSVAEVLMENTDVAVVALDDEPLEEILETLRAQEFRSDLGVVLLTGQQHSPTWTSQALRAGVRGILPRDLSADGMRAALEAVAQGLTVLAGNEDRLQRSRDETVELVEPLTGREREVLEMLAQGYGNKEIAGRLGISEHTVKFHVASILGKLGAATRTEAVSIALRRGLILL